jgi:hypothetical protein
MADRAFGARRGVAVSGREPAGRVAPVVMDRSSAAWAALLNTHAAEARLGPFAGGVGGLS